MSKVLLALATGFVAGILLAPEKGSVTRQKLADGIDNLSDRLSEFANKLSSTEDRLANESTMPKMNAPLGADF